MKFKKQHFRILLMILIALAILLSVFINNRTTSPDKTATLILNSEELKLEIADTDTELQQGLMHRTELAKNSGMLFIFSNEQPRTFWMKNTLISLDIIFLDTNFNVVNIYSSTLPNQILETYSSLKPSKFAVELNARRATELGIQKGDKLVLTF